MSDDKKGFQGLLSKTPKNKKEGVKKETDKKYVRIYVSKNAENYLHQIKREVEYKDKITYTYGDVFEDAMKALAEKKGIDLE